MQMMNKLPKLILVTDDERIADPIPQILHLPRGSAVIFRHYSITNRKEIAAIVGKICKSRGLHFLIAADFKLAIELGGGLHLPERIAQKPSPAIRLWHRRCDHFFTIAAHNSKALRAAHKYGADASLLSPLFKTRSHPDAKPIGLLRFRTMTRLARLPVFALGGVKEKHLPQLHGTAGIASVNIFPPFEKGGQG